MSSREDRIAGTMLGAAAGNALGAGYEFGPPLPDDQVVAMNDTDTVAAIAGALAGATYGAPASPLPISSGSRWGRHDSIDVAPLRGIRSGSTRLRSLDSR